MFEDRPARRKWPRSQRFALSEKGAAAAEAYMATIVASRAEGGRGAYDAARDAWAKQYGIQPNDGLYLAEIKNGVVRLEHIVAALETCGEVRKDAIAALERLLDAGLLSSTEH
jgi:hypothetical protein